MILAVNKRQKSLASRRRHRSERDGRAKRGKQNERKTHNTKMS
jgi:hypothetical protein